MNRRLAFLLLIILILRTCADVDNNEDESRSVTCRDPIDVYVDLAVITVCPMFYGGIEAPFEIEDLADDEMSIKVKKCPSKYAYSPGLVEARCISAPMTRVKKSLTIPLENGALATLEYVEDSCCVCYS